MHPNPTLPPAARQAPAGDGPQLLRELLLDELADVRALLDRQEQALLYLPDPGPRLLLRHCWRLRHARAWLVGD
jgi:hypothetical protein